MAATTVKRKRSHQAVHPDTQLHPQCAGLDTPKHLAPHDQHLHSRTQKRYRDNRPAEQQIWGMRIT